MQEVADGHSLYIKTVSMCFNQSYIMLVVSFELEVLSILCEPKSLLDNRLRMPKLFVFSESNVNNIISQHPRKA